MLKYNGTEVKKITYNGTTIKALTYNGTSILMKQITTGPYKMSDLYPDKYQSMATVPDRVVFCGTTAESMFQDCYLLRSIDTSGIDLSEATDTSNMFRNCYCLTSLNLSSFDTSKVTDMNSMFGECNRLTSITGIFDLSSITDAGDLQNMLYNTKVTSITFKNVRSSIKASITTDLLRMPSNGKITILNTI